MENEHFLFVFKAQVLANDLEHTISEHTFGKG